LNAGNSTSWMITFDSRYVIAKLAITGNILHVWSCKAQVAHFPRYQVPKSVGAI